MIMEMGEGLPVSTPTTGRNEYRVGEANIGVSWRVFEPQGPKPEQDGTGKAVIYIPGWSITEKAKSVEALGQAFADYALVPVYAVDTKSDRIGQSSLSQEAEAVRQDIEQRKLDKITIVGNSQGGAEAIHLASLLQQQNPEVTIEGLVLLDSIGLYRQKGSQLLANYAKDVIGTTVKTGVEVGKALLRRPLMRHGNRMLSQMRSYAPDAISEILREVAQFQTRWPGKTVSEIREMVRDISPITGEIAAPIVIVQGANDTVSNPSTIIPPQSPEDEEKGYIRNINERERFLKETVFPNSPSVMMVVAERIGVHSVSYLRPESVARSSLYLLKGGLRVPTK
ncbi:MAG: alpha/beta hydrolase [Candidatus Levybacteria bacterium]|nr:alpha/beta hydrolase [Candidatus Levybacteria bacterium]